MPATICWQTNDPAASSSQRAGVPGQVALGEVLCADGFELVLVRPWRVLPGGVKAVHRELVFALGRAICLWSRLSSRPRRLGPSTEREQCHRRR